MSSQTLGVIALIGILVVGVYTVLTAPSASGEDLLFLGENDGGVDADRGAYTVTATREGPPMDLALRSRRKRCGQGMSCRSDSTRRISAQHSPLTFTWA
jgi:hypothetical protein